MGEYLRQVRSFRRDIRLFLVFNLLMYMAWGVFQLIFNLYCKELHLLEDDMGAFSAAQTIAMAIGAVSLGPVIDRWGIWRSTVGGLLVFLVTGTGLALSSHRAVLLVLSAVAGLGLAFVFTTTMPFVIAWARPHQRQHVAAVTFAVIGIAGTLGSLLGGILPKVLNRTPLIEYRLTLLAGVAVAATSLVPLFMMRAAKGIAVPVDPSAPREAVEASERRQVRRDMAVFVTVAGLMALGVGAVVPFYNVFLASLGADSTQVGYVFALAGLGAATVGLAAPAVARRLGTIWGSSVIRAAGVPLFALLIALPTLPVAVLAYVGRTTTISMAWPIDSTFISEVLPPKARSAVFGYRSAAWNVGWAVASLVGGFVIVGYGYEVTFAALVVFMALAIILFTVYFGRHPRVVSGQLPNALPLKARRSLPIDVGADPEADLAAAGAAEQGA